MSSDSVPVSIFKNINDNSWDYNYLFQLYEKLKNVSGVDVRFEFEGCRFLQQNAVAFLGALIRLLQKQHNTVFFALQSIAEPVRVNLEQNGFLYGLGLGGNPWDGNSIPYREDTTYDVNDYTDYLSERWLGRGWINVSEQLKDHIITRIIEAYINVFDHADSPIGVVTCGQRYPNKGELKLALVDFGVGIPFTVRTYLEQPNLSAQEALKWAFEPTKTTKDKGNFARGNGLKLLKSFIQENHGKLEIYSDTGYVRIDATGDYFTDRQSGFKGTLVQVTLMCDETRYTLPGEEDHDSNEWFF